MNPSVQMPKPVNPTAKRSDRSLFVRYVIAGLINTLASFVVYSGAILLTSMQYWLANLLATIAGIICGFILARIFVFKKSDTSISRSGPRYIVTIGLQYIVSTGAIGILIHFGISEIVAYILVLPIIVALSFILQKNWVFPNTTKPAK